MPTEIGFFVNPFASAITFGDWFTKYAVVLFVIGFTITILAGRALKSLRKIGVVRIRVVNVRRKSVYLLAVVMAVFFSGMTYLFTTLSMFAEGR